MKHAEVQELLPWFAAESLDSAEQAAVQSHVDTCVECAGELRELKLVHAAVAEDGADEPSYDPNLVNVVLRRIEQAEADNVTRPRRARVISIVGRLGARMQWAGTPHFARIALAAQMLMVVGLAAVLLLRAPVAPTEYGTLSGGTEVTSGSRFSVVFREGVSMDVLNHTLAQLHLNIVAGPSALGLYTLTSTADGDPALVLERLEASGLTTFVAPVPK